MDNRHASAITTALAKKCEPVLSSGEVGMKKSSYARFDIVALMAILLCSSVTMLWLFWRFPIWTGVAAIAILAGLSLSTRLAAPSDGEGFADARERGAVSH